MAQHGEERENEESQSTIQYTAKGTAEEQRTASHSHAVRPADVTARREERLI